MQNQIPLRFPRCATTYAVEAHYCRRETGNQIGKTENHIGYQIRKTACILAENRKPNAKKGKTGNRNRHQNRKTEVFRCKNRKTDLKNGQNRKTENPNAPLYKNKDFFHRFSSKFLKNINHSDQRHMFETHAYSQTPIRGFGSWRVQNQVLWRKRTIKSYSLSL